MTEDEGHLNNLAIGHYVVGAIMVALACLPLLHLGIGVAMLSGVLPIKAEVEGDVEAMPSLIAWLISFPAQRVAPRSFRPAAPSHGYPTCG